MTGVCLPSTVALVATRWSHALSGVRRSVISRTYIWPYGMNNIKIELLFPLDCNMPLTYRLFAANEIDSRRYVDQAWPDLEKLYTSKEALVAEITGDCKKGFRLSAMEIYDNEIQVAFSMIQECWRPGLWNPHFEFTWM